MRDMINTEIWGIILERKDKNVIRKKENINYGCKK